MSCLPNFLVIGAMKAGTYSLHHYLNRHPQIEMSQRRKEVNYFVEGFNAHRGVDWYRAFWPLGKPLRGESSTRYSMRDRHPGVAERIHALLPQVKLIYVVRDPVRRLYSQYVHEVDDNQESRSFEALLDAPDRALALNNSRYHYQLQAYLAHFPASAIHVVCFEELVADPAPVMDAVFRFLGADAGFRADDWGAAHNDSADKRRETSTGRVLRHLLGRRRLRRWPWLRETFTRPIPAPRLDPLRHADVLDLFRHDTRQLEAFTGRSFAHWRSLWP